MADTRDLVEAEFESIQKALTELTSTKDLSTLNRLELAGIGAFPHNQPVQRHRECHEADAESARH